MSSNDNDNLTPNPENCEFCNKKQCSSDYHHRMHCFYCKEFVHSCCDPNCDWIMKDFIPKELKSELGNFEIGPDEVKFMRTNKTTIDLGLDAESDAICNKSQCQSIWCANVWKLAFLQTKHDLEAYKTINSSFRILGLKPEKLDNLVKTGVLDILTSPKEYARARMDGWEKCHPDSLETVVEVYAESMKGIYTILQTMGQKSSTKKRKEEEINKRIQEKAEQEKKAKAESNGNGKVGRPKTTKYEKMLNDHISRLGITEKEAKDFLAKMGITEESYK